MTCNTFICTILIGLPESSKTAFFKDFIQEIIEFKVMGKSLKKTFFATLASSIFTTRYLNKVILDDSNRPIMIVQINVLHVLYGVIVIEIFDVKVIYPRVYASRHYGIIFRVFKILFLGGLYKMNKKS